MLCFVLFYSNHNVSFISFSSFHSILINLHSLLHFLLFFSFLFSSIFYSSFLFFSLLFSTPLPSNVLQAMKVLVEQAVLFNLIGTENILCIYSVLIKFFFIAFSKLNCCFSELFFFVKFFLDFLWFHDFISFFTLRNIVFNFCFFFFIFCFLFLVLVIIIFISFEINFSFNFSIFFFKFVYKLTSLNI